MDTMTEMYKPYFLKFSSAPAVRPPLLEENGSSPLLAAGAGLGSPNKSTNTFPVPLGAEGTEGVSSPRRSMDALDGGLLTADRLGG